jgi:LPXTG-site transpeptidase (sortase) family protein
MSRTPNKDRFLSRATAAKILILSGIIILAVIYFPLVKEQVKYWFSSKSHEVIILGKNEAINLTRENKPERKIIFPIDEEFGIVIPKISANAKIVAEVDSNDSRIYQKALAEGVAQAKGSAFPGEKGNVFIFAHSGVNFSEAVRYNAVFYLLNELQNDDEIFVFYKGQKFTYQVTEKKTVKAEDVQYIKGNQNKKTLTLMTCWPAGTTLRRLIVIGEEK